MTTDADLLTRADTDPRAFREIYDRYAVNVHGFFLRRCANRDVALDLTAETFAQAWQSRHRFVDHRGGSLGPWIFGIARNVLTRTVREQRMSTTACERLGGFDHPARLALTRVGSTNSMRILPTRWRRCLRRSVGRWNCGSLKDSTTARSVMNFNARQSQLAFAFREVLIHFVPH